MPDDLWPGDDAVDVVAVDFYDNGVVAYVTSDAAWNSLVDRVDANGPVGIGAWYRYAKAHGKRFGVPEWGLTDPKGGGRAPTDRTVYIRRMHDFFATVARAGDLAFESYYNWDLNATGTHQLYPVVGRHRRSSALYRKLFGG